MEGLVAVQLTSPSTVPTTYAKKGEAKEGAGSSQDTWRRLTATSWNGTSGVAGHRGAPCNVPENVRLGRPRGPRLAMLVPWLGTTAGHLQPISS
jgi:hypothetical protein